MSVIHNLRTKTYNLRNCGPSTVNCVAQVGSAHSAAVSVSGDDVQNATRRARMLGLAPVKEVLKASMRSSKTLTMLRFRWMNVLLRLGRRQGELGNDGV